MNKKLIIIGVVLLILYFMYRTKKKTTVSQGNPDETKKPFYDDENFIFWEVEPYIIQKDDWLSKLGSKIVNVEGLTDEGKKNLILDITQSLALLNGFNWQLFDNKPSNDPTDPDSLYIGQSIMLPTTWTAKKIYPSFE
jgi:hypothetical protein